MERAHKKHKEQIDKYRGGIWIWIRQTINILLIWYNLLFWKQLWRGILQLINIGHLHQGLWNFHWWLEKDIVTGKRQSPPHYLPLGEILLVYFQEVDRSLPGFLPGSSDPGWMIPSRNRWNEAASRDANTYPACVFAYCTEST